MAYMKIIGLATGEATPFDGQFLVEYDPTRLGVDPNGEPILAHIVTTPDPEQARKFASAAEAMECWRQAYGNRWIDNKPNRPLTAFHVEIGS